MRLKQKPVRREPDRPGSSAPEGGGAGGGDGQVALSGQQVQILACIPAAMPVKTRDPAGGPKKEGSLS